MQVIVITAKPDFDLRYTYDEIMDSHLGLREGAFDTKTKEGRSTVFAGGDRPMLKIEVHLRVEVDDTERMRLMKEIRILVGSDADISFKDE